MLGRGRPTTPRTSSGSRQQVYRDETAPLLDYYGDSSSRVDAVGSVEEITDRVTDAAATRVVTRGRGPRRSCARWRGRDIELKTLGELEAMRAAGALVARTLAAVAALAGPGVSTAELDAVAEQTIRDARRGAVVPGLPRLPGVDLRLGQRADRARHPVARRRCWPTATWCPSTAARSWTAGTATRRSPSRSATCRAGRPRAVGRLRGGALGRHRRGPRRAAGSRTSPYAVQTSFAAAAAARRADYGSSPSTAATASARPCTWTRSCPTTATRARARGCARDGAGDRADAHRGRPRDAGARRRLDRGHRATARARCTGSTRWPSPTTARRSSRSRPEPVELPRPPDRHWDGPGRS